MLTLGNGPLLRHLSLHKAPKEPFYWKDPSFRRDDKEANYV